MRPSGMTWDHLEMIFFEMLDITFFLYLLKRKCDFLLKLWSILTSPPRHHTHMVGQVGG